MVWPHALARHFQAQVIQARERAQVRAIKDSIGHVEVFQMDGVGTPIIGRPRPLPSHDTPNPAHNTYTLKCEEPEIVTSQHQHPVSIRAVARQSRHSARHQSLSDSDQTTLTEYANLANCLPYFRLIAIRRADVERSQPFAPQQLRDENCRNACL